MSFLLAIASDGAWPSGLDWLAIAAFFSAAVGVPLAGFVLMYFDVQRWLRSLRGALVVISHRLPQWPEWARRETPRCLLALGLRFPCTVQDVKRAYRQKVKQYHPDHGGDEQRFRWLQSQFEQALPLVELRDRTI